MNDRRKSSNITSPVKNGIPNGNHRPISHGQVSTSSKIRSMICGLTRAALIATVAYLFGFHMGFQQGILDTTRAFQKDAARNLHQPQTVTTAAPVAVNCTPTTNTGPSTQPPLPQIKTDLFSLSTHAYVRAMSSVDRNEFAQQFDTGVPLFDSTGTNQKVLLLHAQKSLPKNASLTELNQHLSVQDATQNCNYLSLILTEPNRHDQCIAIMGQYNSYHVQKFMRVSKSAPTKIDDTLPLRLVQRNTDIRPFKTGTPTLAQTRQYWNLTLAPYLSHLQQYLDELSPIAKLAGSQSNTIIVMVCNQGQSELLLNFVCHARAHNLDLSSILVFATDTETQQLSESLGLHTFYNEQLFANIPKKHAAAFGDSTYREAIFSKIYCVQLVSILGYDYLFQDVDIVWYKHPFDFFHKQMTKSLQQFDIYMQTDGNFAQFYLPYSGNTGFYYVRNNVRTQYFINNFLASGDLITATKTHQAPFISILSEHASLHGLGVKILPADDFPGGYHYQRKHQFMKYMLGIERPPANVQVDPWIFHMSWTLNKEAKLEFMQQMGIWYVAESCPSSSSLSTGSASTNVIQQCCAAEPVLKCHYKDLPSLQPCHESPAFNKDNKNAKSFYPLPKMPSID